MSGGWNRVRRWFTSLGDYRGLVLGAAGFLLCLLGYCLAHFWYAGGFFLIIPGLAMAFCAYFVHAAIFFKKVGKKK
jgi:CHASE2 domain-containing sensor protein